MRKNNQWGWLLLLFVFSVQADEPDAKTAEALLAAIDVTVGRLEAVQAYNMLLAAQVENAKLKRMLNESQQLPVQPPVAVSSSPAGVPFSLPVSSMAGQVAQTARTTGSDKPATLVLLETYGNGKTMFARLRLANGGVIEVTRGDRLPGTNTTISAISDATIRLSDGTSLSF
ncbi:type IV pilus biogenesis protein PilP [Pectobacterium punjabense]|uniref:Type IV pilus biogenesis protein PilP n=1 Tax=Pectobacterium punjabense TaxID=2108399 RepID=A0ABX6KYZ4_9GAMM|nr:MULTISPECIES: type IV pilus biogenesis protein PilP [Pectobacterium]MBA0211952.1 type IV pilus biogenesis protein PilP [Pectobacterium brasiliense]MBS4430992.1 type IV pilus biogenesis protein PilP [Pectobacterium punjabense]PTA65556.1 type IV pilus biogenesis protein PilP [Pectobacterium punjabense]QJA19280.1 type IV pilus biogenesis protein PilP [Pectobacterium punjabense]